MTTKKAHTKLLVPTEWIMTSARIVGVMLIFLVLYTLLNINWSAFYSGAFMTVVIDCIEFLLLISAGVGLILTKKWGVILFGLVSLMMLLFDVFINRVMDSSVIDLFLVGVFLLFYQNRKKFS